MTTEQIIAKLNFQTADRFELDIKPTCLIKHTTEEGDWYESEARHLCLIEDGRFPNSWELKHLQPYWYEDSNKLVFCWASNPSNVIYNKVNPAIDWDNRYVVAFSTTNSI